MRPTLLIFAIILITLSLTQTDAQADGGVLEPLYEANIVGYSEASWLYATWNHTETTVLLWGFDTRAYVIDAETGQILFTLPHYQTDMAVDLSFLWATLAVWSPDNLQILTSGNTTEVKVWDGQDGHLLTTISLPPSIDERSLVTAQWDSTGSRILIHQQDGQQLSVWDATSGVLLFTMSHVGKVTRFNWNVDNNLIYSMPANEGMEEIMRDALTNAGIEEIETGEFDPEKVFESLAAINFQTTILLWDGETGTLLYELIHPEPLLRQPVWNHNGTQLLTIAYISEIINAPVRSDNGHVLSSVFEGPSTIRIWDTQTGLVLLEIPYEFTIYDAYWTPDETRLVTGTLDRWQVWDVPSGEKLIDQAVNGQIIAMEVISDTQVAILANSCLEVCSQIWQLWNLIDGSLQTAHPYQDRIMPPLLRWNYNRSLGLLAHSENIYTDNCGDDCETYLFVVDNTGTMLARLPLKDSFRSMTWNQAGTQVVTTDASGNIRMWTIP